MRRLAALTLTVLALVLAASPAAHANTRAFRDQRGEVSSGNDIVKYVATNAKRIGVVTHHRNLRANAVDIQFQALTSTGHWLVYASMDGSTTLVQRLTSTGSHPRSCSGVRVHRSLSHDTASLSVPRSCLRHPTGKIRYQVRVQWSQTGGKGDSAPGSGYSRGVTR